MLIGKIAYRLQKLQCPELPEKRVKLRCPVVPHPELPEIASRDWREMARHLRLATSMEPL